MLLAVFSDSHGSQEPLCRAIRTYQPDMVLHLGDYVRDAMALEKALPGLEVRYVRGNCDVGSPAPETLCFALEGVSVFMTHGHLYSVKYTLQSIANAAHFSGARLALFGHTHQAEYRRMGDVLLLNPGSAGRGDEKTFCLLTLEGGKYAWRMERL